MLKIWIVGSASQIGSAINEAADPLEMEIFNTDKDELDITDTDSVINFGEINRPDVIINCAALTSLKECEENPEEAFRVNALGARNLCIVARKINAKIVQFSTDDVFDGTSKVPYTEFDDTNPVTVYGRSKRAGENYVKEFTHRHFIIRSNWVYGRQGKNYVNFVLDKAANGENIVVKREQYASPTSALDLARLVLYLITTNEYGTYHATCRDTCSRKEFAQEILKLAGYTNVNVIEENDSDYIVPRPDYAILDNFILRIINVYEMPTWKESLTEYMNSRKEA